MECDARRAGGDVDEQIEALTATWWEELVPYDDANPAQTDAAFEQRCAVFTRLADRLAALGWQRAGWAYCNTCHGRTLLEKAGRWQQDGELWRCDDCPAAAPPPRPPD